MQLVKCGPRRQGELADLAMLDPSTVSRYVGQLARRGLVERRPDPADGRAVQLVATQRGHDTAHAMIDRRNAALRQVLAGWSESDLRTFTALLTRLNDDVDAGRAAFTPDPPTRPTADPPTTRTPPTPDRPASASRRTECPPQKPLAQESRQRPRPGQQPARS